MKIGNLPMARALERVLELQRRMDAGLPFTEGRLTFLERASLLDYMGLAKAQVDTPVGVPSAHNGPPIDARAVGAVALLEAVAEQWLAYGDGRLYTMEGALDVVRRNPPNLRWYAIATPSYVVYLRPL